MTNKHINELPQFGTKTPVVSVEYLRNSAATPLAKWLVDFIFVIFIVRVEECLSFIHKISLKKK